MSKKMLSPREEVLAILTIAHPNGLTNKEVQQRSDGLDAKQVANALYFLKNANQVELVDEGIIRRYYLVSAPEKTKSTPLEEQIPVEEPEKLVINEPDLQIPVEDGTIPDTLDAAFIALEAALNAPKLAEVDRATLKQAVLARLSSILHPSISEVLDDIAGDLKQRKEAA